MGPDATIERASTDHLTGDSGAGMEVALREAEAAAAEAAREAALGDVDFAQMGSAQIMAFLQSIMRSVDTDLSARADTLRRRNEESARLGGQIAAMERIAAEGRARSKDGVFLDGTNGDQIEGMDVSEWLEEHHPELAARIPVTEIDGHDAYTGEHMSATIKALKEEQNQISSMNEMDMIGFQSIVQTKQLFVNLATQMMSASHDAQDGIVRNI